MWRDRPRQPRCRVRLLGRSRLQLLATDKLRAVAGRTRTRSQALERAGAVDDGSARAAQVCSAARRACSISRVRKSCATNTIGLASRFPVSPLGDASGRRPTFLKAIDQAGREPRSVGKPSCHMRRRAARRASSSTDHLAGAAGAARRPTAAPRAAPRAVTWCGCRCRVDGRPGGRRRLRRVGCGAQPRWPRAPRSSSSSRAARCSTPRGSARIRSPTPLGGLLAGRPPRGRPRRRRAAPRAAGRSRPATGRVADGPGSRADPRRDERRRRQRGRRAARARAGDGRGRGDGRAVGATGERRRERRCCSPQAVRRSPRARALAGHPAPHARPARRLPRRRRRRRSWPGTRRARPRTRACAATAPCASTRCSASPTAWAPARSPPATTRAIADDGDGPLLRGRRRPGQGPDLHARRRWRRGTLARLRFPLAALTKPEVREIAAAAELPVAPKPDSPGPVLPRRRRQATRFLARHGGHRRARGRRSSTAPGACSAATAATTASRSASAAGSAIAGDAARCTCSRPTPREPRRRRSARGRCAARRVVVRDATLHRDGAPRRPGPAALPIASAAAAASRRRPGRGDTAARSSSSPSRPGVAPGQAACLMDGDTIVGHGTIA